MNREKYHHPKIYCLKCPNSQAIKYVGVTKRYLSERLWTHVNQLNSTDKCDWIRGLLKENKKPIIEVIEFVKDGDNPIEREMYYIKKYSHFGLFNKNKCGPSPFGQNIIPPEAIAEMGIRPDREIAEKYGLPWGCISRYRRKNKLGSYKLKGHSNKKIKWEKASIKMLGMVPDQELADIVGCDRKAVYNKRKELGVISYRESSGANGYFEDRLK